MLKSSLSCSDSVHANSVSTYQKRYPDMPRPVLDLGPGRPKLWLRPHVRHWVTTRHGK